MRELFEPLIAQFDWDAQIEPVLGRGSSRERGPLTVADAPLAAPRAFRHKAATPFAPAADGSVRGGFIGRGTHNIVDCPACAVEARSSGTIASRTPRAKDPAMPKKATAKRPDAGAPCPIMHCCGG